MFLVPFRSKMSSTTIIIRNDPIVFGFIKVSRNPETGVSKGCGYVTMSSLQEAKAAIAALDGSVSFLFQKIFTFYMIILSILK